MFIAEIYTNYIYCKLLAAAKEVADAIHVKGKRNTHGLVQGIGRLGGNNITCIDTEHVELEAGTDSGILTVALHLALVVVTGTEGEFFVIGVLGTYAPLYLFQFTLETTLGVAEALENTADGRLVIVFIVQSLLVVFVQFVGSLQRHGGHKEFVGIGTETDAVVLVEGDKIVETKTQVGGDEIGTVVAIGDFAAYVVDVQTP